MSSRGHVLCKLALDKRRSRFSNDESFDDTDIQRNVLGTNISTVPQADNEVIIQAEESAHETFPQNHGQSSEIDISQDNINMQHEFRREVGLFSVQPVVYDDLQNIIPHNESTSAFDFSGTENEADYIPNSVTESSAGSSPPRQDRRHSPQRCETSSQRNAQSSNKVITQAEASSDEISPQNHAQSSEIDISQDNINMQQEEFRSEVGLFSVQPVVYEDLQNIITHTHNESTSGSDFSGTENEGDYIPNSVTESSAGSSPPRRNRRRPLQRHVPETSSDTSDSDQASPITKSRKRIRKPEYWKCNIRKAKTITGQTYISKKGKRVPAKEIRPPCNPCRKKCSEKIAMPERLAIFNKYWSSNMTWDMKRQFIVSRVKTTPVERRRVRNQSPKKNRSCTAVYTLVVNEEEVTVCKKFFLNTLAISETVVRNALKKSTFGIKQEDKRGYHTPKNKTSEEISESIKSHINSFPKYRSHYSRERTNREYLGNHLNLHNVYELFLVHTKSRNPNIKDEDIPKYWLYRKIFNQEFNLGFSVPANDTCDDCDRYQTKLREIQEAELKAALQSEYDKHLADASQRYDFKRKDKEYSKTNLNSKLLTVDLQKCLPTPLLTNGQSFYLRKLWSFNFTITDSTGKKSCLMWDETKAGRGGNELASSLLKWCECNIKNTNVNHITIWSDNCPGQNKNINLIAAYLWIMHIYPNVDVIQHKYLLKGHTHMEADGIHSIIERQRKNQPQFSIATPWDWQQLVNSCANEKNNICVINMEVEDFKKISALVEGSTAPFIHRKKSTTGQPVPYSSMVWIKFEKASFGTMKYKTSFDDNDFQEVCLFRNIRKGIENLENVQELIPVRTTQRAISNLKYRDLVTALQWIPSIFHAFYINLPHNENATDLPEATI